MLIVFAILFAATFAGYGSSAQDYRLGKDIIPDSYDIAIKPYLQSDDGIRQFTFDGEVNITLHAVQDGLQHITLHQANIDILETILTDDNGQQVQNLTSDELVYEPITNKLTIPLREALVGQRNYTLWFKYSGQIRNDLGGIFRASYDNTSWYAITQLHRIDARTAFPCFDEPELKAAFRMRITRPKEYNSYFNTRLIETVLESDGRYTDYFEESPRMSTYLVAFLVGDFVAQGSDNDFKLIMNPKFNNKTAFTQEVALETIKAYDSYTPIPYKSLGNPILQMAGSVSFPHSGMENWGLIIYRDDVLAHEPDYTDGWSNKEYTIMLLMHETAHMWFGNSVTHKWWSYFWLNEGFARYYQYFMANEVYPEYEFDNRFVVNVIHKIFEMDATSKTQPLTSPENIVQSPSQIGYKFSSIAYDKGAAVARMICNAMGKVNFDTSMRAYLQENHLGSTVPEDLFAHWRSHWPSGHNVDLNQLFKDWTEQPGFPIITISTTKSGKYSLKQRRFLLDPVDGSDATLKYTVPITYTTNRERNFEELTPKFYLNKTGEAFEFGDASGDEWIILNLQQSNYHRVFYEAPLLGRLRKAFMASNHSGIHPINRAYLVDDLFAFGRIGLLGYDEIFKFMEYLITETDYLPWQSAFKGFETLYQRLTLAQQKKFGKFLFDVLGPLYERLGFESANDTILDVYNRNNVISWLCKYEHEDCLTQARRIFQESAIWFLQVPPDFRETLYCAASREQYKSFEVYQVLLEVYKAETVPSEIEKILRARGCTPWVDSLYNSILSGDVPQDLIPMTITGLYSQEPGNVMKLYYLISFSVEILTEKLGSWTDTATIISGLADYFTTEKQLEELKWFISANGDLFGASVNILKTAVKNVENNLAWSEKHLGKLLDYLDQRSGTVSLKSMSSALPILAILFFAL